MPQIYDIAIIGTGPAGLSAALTAKARNLTIVWFGNKDISKKVSLAEEIRNYPGLPRVTGSQMQETFREQIEAEELEITEKVINQIFPMGKQFALFSGQESWMAKTILLAMGTAPTTTMEGEEKLLGKGVSYCATCDGRLYSGKRIAIYCTNPEFEPEVDFLADLASEVYVYPTYKGYAPKRGNVTILPSPPVEVLGDELVSGIRLKRTAKMQGLAISEEAPETAGWQLSEAPETAGRQLSEAAGETADGRAVISVDGVFCLKDSYSPVTLVKGLETEENHIKVNRRLETSIPGCYAAGDCTGRPYQYAKAVGEGNVAVHSILEYLHEMG